MSEPWWGFVNDDSAQAVIDFSCSFVARAHSESTTADDLKQEAAILVATRADLQECIEEGEYGKFQYRLMCDLLNVVKPGARKAERLALFGEFRDADDTKPERFADRSEFSSWHIDRAMEESDLHP